MTTTITTPCHRSAVYRPRLRGHRGRATARLGRPAEYVAVVMADAAFRRATACRAREEANYRSLRMNGELVLRSESRARARRYVQWGEGRAREGLAAMEDGPLEGLSREALVRAERALEVARHVERLARGDLAARACGWQNVLRLSARAEVRRCEARRGGRARGTRRARVLARAAAKLASASSAGGDPEPELSDRRRYLAVEVAP